MREILHIACGDRGTARMGNRGYHSVELRDWAAYRDSTSDDTSKGLDQNDARARYAEL